MTKLRIPTLNLPVIKRCVVVGLMALAAIGAVGFRSQWASNANELLASLTRSAREPGRQAAAAGRHVGHDHGHEGHDEGNSLELSPQAKKNVGLETSTIELQTYVRRVSVPALVMGRPGRWQVEVTAPLGGRVTRVYPVEGEAVGPGQPLFDLRLMHEELVQAQSELLRCAEQLDVEVREIRRLEAIVQSGAIPGKRLLERQYEKAKIEAVLNAQRQSLLLHGFTQQQIDDILEKRALLQGLTVVTPEHPQNGDAASPTHPFTIRKLHVKPGEYVDAGAPLCLLMDCGELYIEGRAFEHDADELLKAARNEWEISAVFEENRESVEPISGLKIVYVGNEVDPESRALCFYVGLPNQVVHESVTAEGHRFVSWRFKPGQRMQLLVPFEQWNDRIVLPVDAVANEGVEHYVFRQNGDHFDRVSVHVEYQDQFSTVVANDGSVFPGDVVAMNGAHQLQMALKNKSGGGVDPHAGHSH